MDKHERNHRLDQGLAQKYEWRRQYPSEGSLMNEPPAIFVPANATTPVDYAALGREGNVVRRAQGEAARTAEENASYRQGYLAGSQKTSRLRALLTRVLRNLKCEGGPGIL
jgi:hypothetical protein